MTAERSIAGRRPPYAMIALTGATILVYARTLTFPLLNWDDSLMVVGNADLSPSNWPAVMAYWNPTHPHLGLYAPATYTLYAALVAIGVATSGALIAAPFHAANLVLHLAAGWMLWFLLRRFTSGPSAALVGVATFWLHPTQVEAVAWIASLNTVFAGALVLAALVLYVRAVVGGGRVTFAVSCGLVLLATLAKPSAIAAPAAALAVDRWLLGSRWRAALRRSAAWSILMLPAVLAGRAAQPASSVDPVLGPLDRLHVAADTVGFYVAHVLLPTDLAIDYGRVPTWVTGWPPSDIVYVALAGGATIATATVARRRPAILAAGGIFVAGMLPVLGLVPFEFQRYSTVADRYLYWSMAGVAIAAAMAADRWRLARRLAPVALAAWALAAAYQTQFWSSDETLFDRALLVNPASRKALYERAYVAVKLAEWAPDERTRTTFYYGPIARYENAIRLRPEDGFLRLGVANLYLQAGALDAADRAYRAAAGSDARSSPEVFTNWGITLLRLGQADAAVAALERACALEPNNEQARTLLDAARRARPPASRPVETR